MKQAQAAHPRDDALSRRARNDQGESRQKLLHRGAPGAARFDRRRRRRQGRRDHAAPARQLRAAARRLPGAEKAWAALVAKAPEGQGPQLPTRRGSRTRCSSSTRTPRRSRSSRTTQPTDKTPELAYVTAWAKWRTGDDAGAWQAIIMARKGWRISMPGRDALDRDVLLFAGRTGVTMTDAVAALSPIYGKSDDQQYELLRQARPAVVSVRRPLGRRRRRAREGAQTTGAKVPAERSAGDPVQAGATTRFASTIRRRPRSYAQQARRGARPRAARSAATRTRRTSSSAST